MNTATGQPDTMSRTHNRRTCDRNVMLHRYWPPHTPATGCLMSRDTRRAPMAESRFCSPRTPARNVSASTGDASEPHLNGRSHSVRRRIKVQWAGVIHRVPRDGPCAAEEVSLEQPSRRTDPAQRTHHCQCSVNAAASKATSTLTSWTVALTIVGAPALALASMTPAAVVAMT